MPERAPFARDAPVPLTDDAFGHRDYTEALVSIITDPHPPPTVGVFGPWGVGKSTIIGGIQDRLAGGDTAFVYFDAWRYEGDSLRRQFLIDAANQLKNDDRLSCGYLPGDQLRELHVDTQEIGESLGFSWARLRRAALIGLGFAAFAALLFALGVFDSVLSGNFGQAVLASIAAFTVGTLATLLSQTVVVNATTATTRALQDPDRFAAKFADLLASLRPRRLVVAVDNLDRCSPESAIAMLSTIKTYLEPAVAAGGRPRSSAVKTVDKQVVFVVSVDDEALRRHLLAKETERSPEEDTLAIRRYVDEYLAKFFSARLPIRAILPDDMRGYIAHHLQPLIDARDLDPDHARQLVNLVAAGLRRNPRRVKQFNNDLEARLRLLEERETVAEDRAAGIDPPVSGEVSMVAKLALIETEWPEAFERLAEHPLLLARWEELTETDDHLDWAESDGIDTPRSLDEEARGRQARRDFATFLGQARSIQSPHLRAMLSLKQSPKEAGLPGFTEFRAAASSGDRAQLEGILASEPAERDRLIDRLPEIAAEEVQAGDFPAARAVVDAVVSIELLQPFEQVRRRVLEHAVSTPSLRRELGLLNPAAVLATADLLSQAGRRLLFEPFVARMVDEGLEDDRRRGAADALARFATELTDTQRRQITVALQGESMQPRFSIYRRFAEQAPDLIPPQAVHAALAQAEAAAPGEEAPSLTGYPDALAIATTALPPIADAELTQRAVQFVLNAIRAHTALPALAKQLELGEALLAGLDAANPEHFSQLVQELAANWGAYPAEDHGRLVAFLATFLPRAQPDSKAQVPVNVLDLLFEDPAHAVAVIEDLDPLPDPFRAATLDRLVAHASDPAHTEAGVMTLAKVAGEEGPERIGAVFSHLIAAGHLEAAQSLLEAEDAQLRPGLAQLADNAAPDLAEHVNAGRPLPAELFETLGEAIGEEELASLAATIAARLRDGAPESPIQLLQELRARPKGRLRDVLAAHALDLLVGIEALTPELGQLLGAVCAEVATLDSARQSRLAEKLAQWLQAHPGQLALLSEKILTIEGLAAEPAKTLVEGLLETERATEDPAIRRQLLSAAFHVKGGPRSNATAAVRRRIGELEAGGEIDQEIAAEFASRLT